MDCAQLLVGAMFLMLTRGAIADDAEATGLGHIEEKPTCLSNSPWHAALE
jgi:hypothetical protein